MSLSLPKEVRSVTYPSEPLEVICGLGIKSSKGVWGAVVVAARPMEGVSEANYELLIGTDFSALVPAGHFVRGDALVKYARHYARNRFESVEHLVFVDTLDAIKVRDPRSLVPNCHGKGEFRPKSDMCLPCMFKASCSQVEEETSRVEEESEDLFLKRLQSKVKDNWG